MRRNQKKQTLMAPPEESLIEKTHIGILEVRRHPAVLSTFCKICKINNTSVTIFTTPALYQRLKTMLHDPNDYTFIIKKKNQRLKKFLHQVEDYCKKQEINMLFVNTIHETFYDLYHFSGFQPSVPKILTVHHVNAWLDPYTHMKKISIGKKIKARLMIPQMKKILTTYEALNVIYSPVKEHIKKELDYEKPVFSLPSAVFEPKHIQNKSSTKKEKLTLVIPGLVQKHRKDFFLAISVLQRLPESYLKKMKLILLGTAFDASGKKIIEEFNNLKQYGLTVKTFPSFIDDKTFYRYIQESDILFLPITIQTKADNGILETYGKTVGSGVVYDAIKYAKPVIIPDSFHMISEFKDATLSYTSENELRTILLKCIDDTQLIKEKQEHALRCSSQLSLEYYQKYFSETILPWLKKINN